MNPHFRSLLIAAVVLAGSPLAAAAPAPRRRPGNNILILRFRRRQIAYLDAGAGPPVILVHGLYSSAEMNWVLPGIFKKIAEKNRVVALDLRGHGNSDKPTDDASYGQPMVDDIARLMDHLKIDKAQIVGYSLGGIIAMKFAVDHPDRVIALNLGGMGWLRDGSFQQRIFSLMGDRQTIALTPPACVHGISRLAVSEAQIKSVKPPLEILVGDRDPCLALYVRPLERIRPDVPVITISAPAIWIASPRTNTRASCSNGSTKTNDAWHRRRGRCGSKGAAPRRR